MENLPYEHKLNIIAVLCAMAYNFIFRMMYAKRIPFTDTFNCNFSKGRLLNPFVVVREV